MPSWCGRPSACCCSLAVALWVLGKIVGGARSRSSSRSSSCSCSTGRCARSSTRGMSRGAAAGAVPRQRRSLVLGAVAHAAWGRSSAGRSASFAESAPELPRSRLEHVAAALQAALREHRVPAVARRLRQPPRARGCRSSRSALGNEARAGRGERRRRRGHRLLRLRPRDRHRVLGAQGPAEAARRARRARRARSTRTTPSICSPR